MKMYTNQSRVGRVAATFGPNQVPQNHLVLWCTVHHPIHHRCSLLLPHLPSLPRRASPFPSPRPRPLSVSPPSLSPLLSPLISLPLFSLSKDRRFISPSVPSVSPFCDWPPLDRWPGSHTPCWVVQSTACRLLSTHNESKETPPTKHVDSTYCGATLDIRYRWLYIYMNSK